MADSVKAAPGTLATYLKQSIKRKAEVGWRILFQGLEDVYIVGRDLKVDPKNIYT